jgi:hypothetical protein
MKPNFEQCYRSVLSVIHTYVFKNKVVLCGTDLNRDFKIRNFFKVISGLCPHSVGSLTICVHILLAASLFVSTYCWQPPLFVSTFCWQPDYLCPHTVGNLTICVHILLAASLFVSTFCWQPRSLCPHAVDSLTIKSASAWLTFYILEFF